ncbi:MAG: hypothetical protein HGA25_02760 [Clostridiales bacterium]|nr:hypothetical protein [Clostridiales bacterium]
MSDKFLRERRKKKTYELSNSEKEIKNNPSNDIPPTTIPTENTIKEEIPIPVSTENAVKEETPIPVSTENTVKEEIPIPVSTENTVKEEIPIPVSTENTVKEEIPLPIPNEGITPTIDVAEVPEIKDKVTKTSLLMNKKSEDSDRLFGVKLLVHQKKFIDFVRDTHLDGKTHRDALFYDMGMGKTITALCAALLIPSLGSQDIRQIIIVCPASLQMTWENEIKKFSLGGVMESKNVRVAFVSINSGAYVYQQFLDAMNFVGGLDSGDNITVICDEIHVMSAMIARSIKARLRTYMGRYMGSTFNFRIDKKVFASQTMKSEEQYENTKEFIQHYVRTTGKGAEGNPVIDPFNTLMLMKNLVLIGLTGTAITEDPFELAPLLNLIIGPNVSPRGDFRNYYFPMDYYLFSTMWQNDREDIKQIIRQHSKIFSATTIEGDESSRPTLLLKNIKLNMSDHQWRAYEFANSTRKEGLEIYIRMASDIVPPEQLMIKNGWTPFDISKSFVESIPKELCHPDIVKDYSCKMYYILDFAIKNPKKLCLFYLPKEHLDK